MTHSAVMYENLNTDNSFASILGTISNAAVDIITAAKAGGGTVATPHVTPANSVAAIGNSGTLWIVAIAVLAFLVLKK
jgi:hypothetical protein